MSLPYRCIQHLQCLLSVIFFNRCDCARLSAAKMGLMANNGDVFELNSGEYILGS